MSHICLMANRTGAVVAGDTFTSPICDPHSLHPVSGGDQVPNKCHIVPHRGIIWVSCGLNAYNRARIPLLIASALAEEGDLSKQLDALMAKLAPYTAALLNDGTTSPITLFLAQRQEGRTRVFHRKLIRGQVHGEDLVQQGAVALYMEDGSHAGRITPPDGQSLPTCSFEALREAARQQIQKAIDYDERLDREDLNYRRAVGGRITSYGIRLKER